MQNKDDVIKAAKKVIQEKSQVKFIVTGEGPAVNEVKKEIVKQNLSENVKLMGFLSEQKIIDLYQSVDVFATASTFETQGLAALEALSCSTPVVAANAMALPEMIKEDYNGYLFEQTDTEECARKIIKALEIKGLNKNRMKKNARETAIKYSLSNVANKWQELYVNSVENYRK